MSEAASYGTGSTARLKNWASAMGGAYVMILDMDIAPTDINDLHDCGRLVSFMESTDLTDMSPADSLQHAGTEYVLAQSGVKYIAYASNLSGNIGLKNMSAGLYDFTWLDCVTGATVNQTDITGDEDPVALAKERAISEALKVDTSFIQTIPDALKMAVLGNVIDFGSRVQFELNDGRTVRQGHRLQQR